MYRSFPSLLRGRALVQSIAATLQRVLIGFGLAAMVGVPLGILAGSWRVVEAAGAPLALFGRNLPVAALTGLPMDVIAIPRFSSTRMLGAIGLSMAVGEFPCTMSIPVE